MKKPTIRFYSSSDTYQGFKYLSEVTYFELLNWLKSGNYLKHKEQVITASSSSNLIFALLRKGKS